MGTKQRAVRFAGATAPRSPAPCCCRSWSELQKVPGVVLVAAAARPTATATTRWRPLRIDLLKQIAELLAEAGIATLRYDKRGIAASTPRPRGTLDEQERFFAWDNFVGDVAAAHAELLKHDEIKPYATALLGHSEGGLLALAAAAANRARTAPHGLVLAATPGRPMSDIVRAQIARGAPQPSAPPPSAP